MTVFCVSVLTIALGLLTVVATTAKDTGSLLDDSVNTSVLMLSLVQKRPEKWPVHGMEAFLSSFREHFELTPETELTGSVVFDTCIVSLSDTESNTSHICDRMNINSNSTHDDSLFVHENSIAGCIYGYTPVPVPDYMINTNSKSASMLVGYHIIGALAVILLLGQLAYVIYRFKGVSFVKPGEVVELD